MNAPTNIVRDGNEFHFDHEIDVRGLSCPFPVFSTKASIDKIKSGEVIKVLATDPKSSSYFESLARQTAFKLLSWSEINGEYVYFLGKS